jgi:glycosyltransferase involved in cell wall biosynthesis
LKIAQVDLYHCDDGDGYLAFIGRICPEKRPDWAIEIAHRVGLQLIIAAKVDHVDRAFYETRIELLLKHPRIDFNGEIGEETRTPFSAEPWHCCFRSAGRNRSVL